jgi:cytochrome P450 family 142 subfamily A polypeptide 1
LRSNAPVYHDEANRLYGVSRHADIAAVERDAKVWSNAGGYRPQLPPDPSMIGMDDPEHAIRRRLIYDRFTPRGVMRYAGRIRATAVSLITDALARGAVDAVSELAAPLPARVIVWLLGYPDDAVPDLVRWSQSLVVAGGGPRYITDEASVAIAEFMTATLELAAERRRCPAGDLLSVWTHSDRYDNEQLAYEALLLLVGGAETTRTVIATAIDALIRHPDQWELLRRRPARISAAVEEFVRWTTPILNMCRTNVRNAEVAGVPIPAGSQVLLMYGSANRDETVFDRPEEFDVTRPLGAGPVTETHLAFGLGTHFCLGASLARLELRIFFEEFLSRVGVAAYADDQGPRILQNPFVRGVTSFPITLRPGEPAVPSR